MFLMIYGGDSKRPALIFGEQPGEQPGHQTVTFGELSDQVTKARGWAEGIQEKIFELKAEPNLEFVVKFLALLSAGKPTAIFSDAWTPIESEKRRTILHGSHASHPDLAIILFTSGSSGQPKAVQLSRANIDANTQAVLKSLDFGRASEQTLFLPLSYSYGLLGHLVPAIQSGMTTRVIANFIEVKGIFDEGRARGMWSGVPSHWEAILSMTDPSSCQNVTHVISAGAPMGVELRRKLRGRFANAMIYNNYGQTEASPRVLSFSSAHPSFFESGVGFPVGDWRARIEADGELWLAGSQVMLGYLGDAEGTAAKIVSEGSERWLKTGDAASVTQDGLVSILGRKDDLFNIGGERTSRGEVEAALRQLTGVGECALLIEPHPIYGVKLAAFLVTGGISVSRQSLVAELSRHLSPHKVPREFYLVERLPRTANGKLAFAELPALKAKAQRVR